LTADTEPVPIQIKDPPPPIHTDARGDDPRRTGLRQRHKADKLRRISAAAISLFSREGFDGTTLRDIASAADVALATLSLYARDKRDLVLMIFNKVIPPLIERGRRNTSPAHSLAENMVAFFEPVYAAYAHDVTLYRTVLGQIYTGPISDHAKENAAILRGMLDHLTDIVRGAIATGDCRPDIDVAVHARSLFYLHFAAVRVWLFQEQPDVETGLAELRTLFEQHVAGMRGPMQDGETQVVHHTDMPGTSSRSSRVTAARSRAKARP
jgi:AcrR family transcriptional regulator